MQCESTANVAHSQVHLPCVDAIPIVASSPAWIPSCTDARAVCEHRCRTTDALNVTLGSWNATTVYLVRVLYQRMDSPLTTPGSYVTAAAPTISPYTCFSYGSGVQVELQELASCARNGDCAEQWAPGSGLSYFRLTCAAFAVSSTWTIERKYMCVHLFRTRYSQFQSIISIECIEHWKNAAES